MSTESDGGMGQRHTGSGDGNELPETVTRQRALVQHEKAQGWLGKLKATAWHGGSWFDAWLNAVAAQIGSVILVFPYTLSQMGYGWGVGLQFVYGIFGCWTVYLLCWLYTECENRRQLQNALHDRHIVQYHEVIGALVGKWPGHATRFFNLTQFLFGCVVQIIACGSDVYYLYKKWSKRTWTYVFGAIALPCVLFPSFHNLRVVSFLGVITTAFTAAYLTGAALEHGQVKNVRHSGPSDLVQFFSGATNILFAFGGHALSVEIMEAMWKPKNYKYAYFAAVSWTFMLTVPDSISVYWAFGDILLHNSNAYGVLPRSKAKTASIIMMIYHQYVAIILNLNPIFLVVEKISGVHVQKSLILKYAVRIPVVLVIWFIALALPFFGPINSVLGAFLSSFSVYIIPCVAFMYTFGTKAARENSVWKPSKMVGGWAGMFAISGFIALWVFVLGFGMGAWASVTNLIRQVNTFGLFADCYQC